MRRPGPRARGGGDSSNCAWIFLDDVRNLRANAVMIIGVLCFAGLVWCVHTVLLRARTGHAQLAWF